MTTSRRPARSTILLASALLIAAIPALATGCDKKDAAPGTPASATPPPAPSSAAAPTPSATPLPVPPAAPNGANAPASDPVATLFGRMAEELKNRPPVHPSVDEGFAAFTKAGVTVPKTEQSLGTTYKAAFCEHGLTTAGDMAILLCEYADEAHAKSGLAEAGKLFLALEGRHSWTRKTLLMTITFQDHPAKPQALEEEKKVLAAFNAL